MSSSTHSAIVHQGVSDPLLHEGRVHGDAGLEAQPVLHAAALLLGQALGSWRGRVKWSSRILSRSFNFSRRCRSLRLSRRKQEEEEVHLEQEKLHSSRSKSFVMVRIRIKSFIWSSTF